MQLQNRQAYLRRLRPCPLLSPSALTQMARLGERKRIGEESGGKARAEPAEQCEVDEKGCRKTSLHRADLAPGPLLRLRLEA